MKIVIGGQMDKEVIEKLINKYGGEGIEVSVKSDLDAVMAVQMGQAKYYFGACATGAGGALAMALGLLGQGKCCSISVPGKIMTDEEIEENIKLGKVAFGFVNTDAEKVVPIIMKYIKG